MRHLIPFSFLTSLWQPSQSKNRRKAPPARTARTRRTVCKAPLRSRHPILWQARLGFLLMAALAVPGWLLFSQQAAEFGRILHQRAIELSAGAGFIVRTVLVEGRSEITRATVMAALGVTYGQPLITFDQETARKRLETISWVQSATIERRLNGTIYIHITERHPLALWQKAGRLVAVDGDGVILASDELGRFSDLPLIVGDDAPRHAPELFAIMSSGPDLKKRVMAAIRVGRRRWDLQLGTGIRIRLPAKNQKQAWETLRKLEQRHEILARDVVVIDLRSPDRLVLQLSTEALEKLRVKQEEAGRDT
jgi:cell division protein FtsQ